MEGGRGGAVEAGSLSLQKTHVELRGETRLEAKKTRRVEGRAAEAGEG